MFIFGGQRKRDDYLNDFFSINVDTDEVDVISTGTSPGKVQDSLFNVKYSEVS